MFKDAIDTLAAHLDRLVTSKTVVGEPIVSGSTTIIPILNAGFGFGAGGGEGTEPSKGTGSGGGSGAGVSLKPTALVVIQDGDVKVYSLSQKGTLEKLVEMMPTVMSKVKDMGKDGGCC